MPKSLSSARRFRTAVLPALLLSVAACGDDEPTSPVIAEDIIDIVSVTSDVSTLQTAVQAAGLESALRGEGPFTVFAPVNAAFDELGAEAIAELLETDNVELLSRILTFHVVPGAAVFSGDLLDGQAVTTLEGERLTIGVSGSAVTVNGAQVISADIEASNGVIHLIDAVLLPELDIVETAIVTSEINTLVKALAAGDLVSTLQGLGPFTVFAPVNEAFAALGEHALETLLDPSNWPLTQKILTYHVVYDDIRAADLADGTLTTVEGSDLSIDLSGPAPMVNGARVIATDIVAGNGVIHLIDGVLTENADLVDVATLNGFSTLLSLVSEADLVGTLRGSNDGNGFTVFAPTNEAFASLASVPSGQALVDVLTYHVVNGTVESSALTDAMSVATVEGTTFTVNISGNDVTITDASGATVNVVLTDVPASNGVVHVIDGVILPN